MDKGFTKVLKVSLYKWNCFSVPQIPEQRNLNGYGIFYLLSVEHLTSESRSLLVVDSTLALEIAIDVTLGAHQVVEIFARVVPLRKITKTTKLLTMAVQIPNKFHLILTFYFGNRIVNAAHL